MADDFSRCIARIAAAQIAEASGFDACQDSAIEILADLLLRYLSTICASSHSYAELAGRSQSNLADVLLSLEELGVTADDLHQHLELQKMDVPFAHTLAPYPVRTQRAVPPTFGEQGEQQPAHIPSFLPAFPDPHTYQQTAAYAGHEGDPYKQRQSMLEAKQKAEAALNKLHQRMSSKAIQPGVNPFLIAPAVEQLPVQLPTTAAAEAGGGGGGCQPTSTPTAAAAAAANGVSDEAAAAAVAGQQGQTVQQLPQQQQQQQLVDEEDEEDALFEQAAVLKAFSSIVAPELVRQVQGKVEVQQQEKQQQDKQPQEDDVGVVEEQPMDVDGAAGAADAAAAAATWLGWKQVQHQDASTPAAAAAANAVAEAEVLRFGIDSLAARKRAVLSLAGRQGPVDVYAQQMEAGRVTGVGGGSRQRKSKYDADPKLKQAEGILGAGPEAVFDAVGGSMHSMWDTGADLDLV